MTKTCMPNRTLCLLTLCLLLLSCSYNHYKNIVIFYFYYTQITSFLPFSILTIIKTSISNNKLNKNASSNTNSGVDVSFPIQDISSFFIHGNNKEQERYKEYIQGCITKYDKTKCITNENIRLQHNMNQPKLYQNYTMLGYEKLKVPNDLYKSLSDYFRTHYDTNNVKEETWPDGNTYVNHWISPTAMIPLPKQLKTTVITTLEPIVKQWISQKSPNQIKVSSIYGIRIYKNNSILAPHVDRIPLISSVIINIDQDVDTPWPLEVYGHDGKVRNLTLVPGEMILYESHTVLHGRPSPLGGRFYANLFIHYEPIGFGDVKNDKLPYAYAATTKHPVDMNLYLAASNDDIHTFQNLHPRIELIYQTDKHGWNVLHQAARAGSYNVIHFLLQNYDYDVNVRTNFGYGGTALYWAIRKWNESKNELVRKKYEEIIDLLKYQGGVSIEPEEIK